MPGNDQDKRLLIAVVLSMIVVFVWGQFFAPPPPPPAAEVAVSAAASATAPVGAAASGVATPTAGASLAATVPSVGLPLAAEGWSGEVHSRNGALRSVDMKEHFDSPVVTPWWTWLLAKVTGGAAEGWEPYTGGADRHGVLEVEGALGLAGAGPFDDDGAGTAEAPAAYTLSPSADGVVATRTRADGLRITKTYRKGEAPFGLELVVRFENTGSAALPQTWVGVVDRMGVAADQFTDVYRPMGYADSDSLHVTDLEDMQGIEVETSEGPVSWFGLTDRYFLAALAPVEEGTARLVMDDLPGGRMGSFLVDERPLGVGESRELRFVGYLGPKNLDYLNPLGHDLDRAVDFGFFALVARPLLWLLKFGQKVVINWGLAILLLTLTVKLVLWPLTQSSFESGQKMQALAPKLQALRDLHKDNQEVIAQETMKLYAEHKVNPVGGCLPMLLQMPVWLALYNVMLQSVELHNSSFVIWNDLTAADPYGILPTAYMGLMFAQQSMMPMTGMDPTQAKMMKMMPLIFGIFMYNFPSGLVLYFCTNMLLTIAQQWLIKRNVKPVGSPA